MCRVEVMCWVKVMCRVEVMCRAKVMCRVEVKCMRLMVLGHVYGVDGSRMCRGLIW